MKCWLCDKNYVDFGTDLCEECQEESDHQKERAWTPVFDESEDVPAGW